MKDQEITKEQLIEALVEMRQQITELLAYPPDSSNNVPSPAEIWSGLAEHIESGLLMAAGDTYLMEMMNPAFARMYEYTIEELTGRPLAVIFAPELRAELPNLMQGVAEKGHATFELKHLRRDGTVFPVSMDITAVKDQDGKLSYYALHVRQITGRQDVDKALRTYITKLEQSNRELQDFAHIATHDLQEPLRKIQTSGVRLKIKYETILDDQGRDYLKRIEDGARQIQELLQGLLTFSGVTTQTQPFTSVDLATLTQTVLLDLEAHIQKVEGQVEVGDLPTIEADPAQMEQLLHHLISNGLKFHRPQEKPVVRVYSHLFEERRQAGPHPPGTQLCQIIVEDNGIGFDEKHLSHIFDVFQRLHDRSDYEGTGIGLAICRKIVERHRGSITAKSSPGRGAMFIVTLPASQQPSAH